MFDKDWWYVLISEPQKLRYALTPVFVFRVPFKEREPERRAKNRFMWYTSFTVLQKSWFFSYSFECESIDVFLSSIQHSHECGFVYTCFMQHCFLLDGKKTSESKKLLCESCGALICLRIIPVKIESGSGCLLLEFKTDLIKKRNEKCGFTELCVSRKRQLMCCCLFLRTIKIKVPNYILCAL